MKYFSLLLITFVLFSCTRQSSIDDTVKIRKTYFQNGNLKTEQQFKDDSIQHGFYRRYYKNTQLEIEIYYQNNKKHGKTSEYYENGKLKHTEYFKNGMANGKAKWYSMEGKLMEESFFYDGKIIGEAILYYPNGDYKAYLYYDHLNRLMYRVDYNENREIVREKGTGFPIVFVNTYQISVGDTFKAEIVTINPPHADKLSLYVGEFVNADELRSKKAVKLNDGEYFYSKCWNTPGEKKWGALLKIKSTFPNAKDSFQYLMEVKVIN